ncbi:hypothetical protein [Marinobacter sp. JSM 1782161]|uniref:hypothetical protein n=1 Tax=Marinobacter sp. JSM 1782161 TaxID=2685906 RepID=UPI0014039C1D|nr:hypothetical protein [Marinobacter sp. JSM 1782161]
MYNLSDSEIRNTCKERLESLEYWLRRLIDVQLSDAYGDFFNYSDEKGNRIIKNKIIESLESRIIKEPQRYSRKVDAILLDDEIDIICNPKLYNDHFKGALEMAFPDGPNVARTFLKRLVDPRNRLAHANPISQRQSEQVVCYTNDVIESIKEFYRKQNMSEDYNVPLILKLIDSYGNVYHRDQFGNVHDGGIIKNLSNESQFDLRPGDTLSLEIEVDPSFSPEEYDISWASAKGFSHDVPNGQKAVINITEKQVGKRFDVQCRVTSKKQWHRMSLGADDFLIYYIRVLPPL